MTVLVLVVVVVVVVSMVNSWYGGSALCAVCFTDSSLGKNKYTHAPSRVDVRGGGGGGGAPPPF